MSSSLVKGASPSTSGRKLDDRLVFNLIPEWSLYFRPKQYTWHFFQPLHNCKPFLGTNLLEFRIGRGSGALKALSTSGRKLEDRLMFNLTPEWSLYFRPKKYPDVLGQAACTSGATTAFSSGGNMGGNTVTITTYNSSLVRKSYQ